MSRQEIHIVDSHTGGEPTRVVVAGGPELPLISLAERRDLLRRHHDAFRSAVVNEPRGHDAVVGALPCPPLDKSCVTGVIFFNNVGYINMCGHGTIGLVATLAHLGKIEPGVHRIETPVGTVGARLHADSTVTLRNVPSWRTAKNVAVQVPGVGGVGQIVGDVAWGGNWFFLVSDHGQELTLRNLDALTALTWQIRVALHAAGITGDDGMEIDHVELFGPSTVADSRNFVLCPGKAYDRSPCGTGTSAKLACLYADGKLAPGEVWRQEGIVGSVFEGTVDVENGRVIPSITGSAYIMGEGVLIFEERDPFRAGIGG